MALTRTQVVQTILAIKTPDDVVGARKLRDEYLREHPNDEVVWGASEGLERCAESFDMPFEPIDLERK
jgi:hypothetical protein